MKLHYIYDPLCGWCYGASPLLAAAAKISALSIAMSAGGIAEGQSRRLLREVGGQGLPTFVLEHDQKRQVVNFGDFLGQPKAFIDFLKNQIPVVANDTSAPFCGIGGC